MNDEVKLSRLGALAREGLPDTTDPAHDDAERERFVAAVARGDAAPRAPLGHLLGDRSPIAGARPPARVRWVVALSAAATLVTAAALFWRAPAPQLQYAVEGAAVAEGYVRAHDGAGARVAFSDGSAVELAAGASMRVAEVTSSGARMLLEDGRATLRITKRPEARWSVEAGPFVVLVTGTAFQVEWARGEETLRVDLNEGAVTVRGPLAPDGLPLRAGQRLIARLHEGDVQIVSQDATSALGAAPPPAAGGPEQRAEAEVGSAGPSEPDIAPGPPGVASEASIAGQAPSRTPSSPALSWSKRVAAGDFQGVLAEAEQRGISGVLERAPLDDLVALGDAARYAKRGDVARSALAATRKRFPGSSAGKAAAFLLGRLADGGGSPGAALSWYDTYLRESPGGPFAAEALGRKMVAVERISGRAAARPVAEQYLQRYPRGAHAALARELVGP